MRPGGPRNRPSQRQPPSNAPPASRNEVFENIFGRPAGGHHLGPSHPAPSPAQAAPQPPPGGSYGYNAYPSSSRYPLQGPPPQPAYLNPAQPSYPPGQVYAAPAPPRPGMPYPLQQGGPPPPPTPFARRPSQDHGQPYAPSSNGHGQMMNDVPDRRASLAPSAYSTNSPASFYSPSPNPDALLHNGRMTHAVNPPVPGASSTRLPPLSMGAGDPYGGYNDAPLSSASSTFPRRPAPGPMAPPNASVNSLPSSSSSSSQGYIPPARSSSRANTLRSLSSPNADSSQERLMSPPPDYLKSMSELGFDGAGAGPLDSIAGIPRRGTSRGEAGLSGDWEQTMRQNPDFSRPAQAAGGHRRMPSDSSLNGAGFAPPRRELMTPLSTIDSTVQAPPDSPLASPLTPTGSESGGFQAAAVRRLSGRKSMESTMSLPAQGMPPDGQALQRHGGLSPDNRSTSFSGSSAARVEALSAVRSGSVGHGTGKRTLNGRPPSAYSFPTTQASQRSLSGTLVRSSSTARAAILQNMPQIYPALLSRVAEAFKQIIFLAELTKDGITYKDSFDGRTAVSIIADIIKTPDRNLALLLGRSLDAQKFFHDVTYDHRLRDNPHEIYQFKERLTAPFMNESAVADSPQSDHAHLQRTGSSRSGRLPAVPLGTRRSHAYSPESNPVSSSMHTSESAGSFFPPTAHTTPATSTTSLTQPLSSPLTLAKGHSDHTVPHALAEEGDEGEDDLPVGVFTLLTDCYSPTCTRDSLCYSINCPRRLEQMKRLNMKPQPGLSRKLSEESLHDVRETGTLWIESVSQDILNSVDDTEKRRQEAINEVIYTERDFVRDLEYLRDSWVKPLRTSDVVPANRRDDFVQQVFWNFHEVLAVNHVLAERLTKRQKQQPVVQSLGDLFLERVPYFDPFVKYGAHQLFGKYEFEKEKGNNPAFQKFVDETERKPESRKLELNGYLTKPTTRLGRYPLLLEAVLKHTPEGHSDKRDLPEVIKMIKAFLTKVNAESGKSENIFKLAQLEQQLVFRPNETIDLRLRDKNRELVHEGPLKRRGGTRDEVADLNGILFDHAFLLVKPKWVNKAEQYRVYRRPIPLELLVMLSPEDAYNSTKLSTGRSGSRLISRQGGKPGSGTHAPPKPESKHGFSLTIIHLGKKGYQMQLWVDTWMSRKKWLENVDKQQAILREKSTVFVTETVTEGYFVGLRKINCVSPYDQGNRMIYGTDEGVYFSNLRDDKLRVPVKVIELLDVTQVDVLEEFQLLIVLHERSVTTFPLDCLDPNDPGAALKRGKKISSHTSFFKTGICLGKTLVAVVKSSTLSSTIKVMEPVDLNMRGKKQQGSFMRRLNVKDEALKLFKEFYIPTESSSIHFLKTKLCVGCTRGFEIVDLDTLEMQGLLDPSDASLDFVLKRDNVRPIAIYRIEEDFLLCYDEFAFYVNKNGWRARPKWAIIWEGVPTGFALQYPYVVAFDPTFIEVHHVETGHLVQIIPAAGIRCLFADTPPSRTNARDPGGVGAGMGRPMMLGHPSQPAFAQRPGQPPGGTYGAQGPGGMNQFGMMRPPPSMGGGQPYAPPQPQPIPPQMTPQMRFARHQVLFTCDDGHVQFLTKYQAPPPPSLQASTSVLGPAQGQGLMRPGGAGHAHRMSH